MSALVATTLGAGVGLGLLLVVLAVRGGVVLSSPRRSVTPSRPWWTLPLTVTAAVVVYTATGWMAAAALAAAGAWVVPRLAGAKARHQADIDLVEAVASWAEQLRDTMAGASGLEQAIAASAPVAPRPLASAVARLAARLEHLRVADALRMLADEVDHPSCDFVVAALVTAAEHEARELGPLLTQLAECARADAQMRARVWAGRARTRTSVRVISGAVALFAVGLALFNRSYLEPYDSAVGQIVIIAIGALFAGSVLAMERMGRIDVPDRFVRRRVAS